MPMRKLDASPFEKLAIVRLQDRLGSKINGVLVRKGSFTKQGKTINTYDIAINTIDARAVKDQQDVAVSSGDKVTLFGSKGLDKAMAQVQKGETVEIAFLGKKGQAYVYDVQAGEN